jgi:prophage regulatory protein
VDPTQKAILRLPEVLRRTGLSKTVLHERIDQGEFPRQIALGERAVGWHEDRAQVWINSRPEAGTGNATPPKNRVIIEQHPEISRLIPKMPGQINSASITEISIEELETHWRLKRISPHGAVAVTPQ